MLVTLEAGDLAAPHGHAVGLAIPGVCRYALGPQAVLFDLGGGCLRHFSDNPASARIIAKFGFASQGKEMRDCAARGARAHCLTYRLDRAAALDRGPGKPVEVSGAWAQDSGRLD